MWDLDNLKYVNDTYGHEMGDRYIRLFADQLKRLSSLGAVVERHSGDEFMAFLCGDSEEQIREEIRQFFCSVRGVSLKVDEDYELPLRASAGVTWYPRQARDFASLTRYADFAMYMAKHSTKGVLEEFDFSSYQKNSYLLSGREELNQLLERDDVPFAVQPILSRDGSIFGYEALMRPNSKNLKNIQEVLTLAKRQAKLPQFERLTWVCAIDGRVFLNGKDITRESVTNIRRIGMSHVPEDRMMNGCAAEMSVQENLTVSNIDTFANGAGMILKSKIKEHCQEQIKEFMIKTRDENQSIGSLSGGNIQKAIVAREFKAESDLLVLNQPTRGVDVGAISFIHSKILEMRSHKKAILLVSADLNELISLSDRILVMHKGKVVAALRNEPKVTEQELGLYMLGIKKQEGLG